MVMEPVLLIFSSVPVSPSAIAAWLATLRAPARINAPIMPVVAFELRHFVRSSIAFILAGILGAAAAKIILKRITPSPRWD